jgi:hypothetical protein
MPHLLLLLSATIAAGLNGGWPLLLLRPRLWLRVGMAVRLGLCLRLRGERSLLRARFGRRQRSARFSRAALEQRKDIHWSTSQRIGRSGVIPAGREVLDDS